MRNHTRHWAMLAIVVSGGVFACTGGGGPLADAMSTWESSPSSVEHAASTHEAAPGSREVAHSSEEPMGASAEPGPGAQGGGAGGAFACAGTYSCVEAGKSDSDEITLTAEDGVCAVRVGNGALVLSADGSLLSNGQNVGSWHATAGGFVVTTEEGSVECTRASAGSDTGAGSGTGPGTGGGTGGGSGSGGTSSPPTRRDAGG